MILKFEDFITEQDVLNFIDIDIINESRKEAKRVAEIAKKQMKKWKNDTKKAMEEYKKATLNKELFVSDFEKYSEECKKKMKKFNETFVHKGNDSLDFTSTIYFITVIKNFQTTLFRYGLDAVKRSIKNSKEVVSKYRGSISDDDIYKYLYDNQKDLEKYIKGLVERISKNIEDTCKHINDTLDDIEEKSDTYRMVFGDAKIKNKERLKKAREFITVYHSDIEYFVKEYKLIGIEYDKRIKLVDKQEIFNRFYKKVMETIEEEYKK
jgi:hypothetical protein